VKLAIVALIASRPVTGSSGMLWYTASSLKKATIRSRSTSCHASQKRVTVSMGSTFGPPSCVAVAQVLT
jgi:hypothetical protein